MMDSAATKFALKERFCILYKGMDKRVQEVVRAYDSCQEHPVLLIAHDLEELQKGDALFYILIGPKESDLLLQAIEFGVDSFLPLPLNIDDLKKAIEKMKTKFYLQRAKEYNVYMLHQYKNAIDSSNILSKTDINGIITYVNDEFCKISGYKKEELIGKNHNIVRHPDVPKKKFEQFWKRILSKKIWKGTVKNRAKDGRTFYVNTTVIPITDYRGDIVEFVAIRYDVTESVKLQEELKKKEEELEALNRDLEKRIQEQTAKLRELNSSLERRIQEEVAKNRQKDRMMFQQAKLASLGEILGNIAHQWRQPLMELSILFYKIKKQNIDDVYEHGIEILERMNQTIIDFQNFYRPDKEKEHFSVEQSIRSALKIIDGSLKKEGIEVLCALNENHIVRGYPNEFSQVVINLLSNAKDALRGCKEKKCIWIEIKEKDDGILIEVMDNGGGIEENIIDKIFDPYFTTKENTQGIGLGLYMSKMIIEKSMGGRLWASNIAGGAKFSILLPKVEVSDGV